MILLLVTLVFVLVNAMGVSAACDFDNSSLLVPNGDEAVNGVFEISWNPAVCDDNEGINAKYKAGACTEDSNDYTLIGTCANVDYTDGDCDWDTTALADGEYCVRIEQSGNPINNADHSNGTFSLDNTAPELDSAKTGDGDADGFIDFINVTIDEDGTGMDACEAAGWTVTGDVAGVIGVTGCSVLSDVVVQLNITDGLAITDDTPLVEYDNGGHDNADAAGNEILTGDVEAADGAAPIVADVDITDDELSESDVGDIFNVTIEYNEDMDDGVDPTVEFDPAVASSLVGCAGDWKDDDIFAYWCSIADDDVEVDDVNIDVSGAEDVVGNVQVEETDADAFSVDTLQPEVLDAWAEPDPARDLLVTVTVDFSEEMDQGVDPVVEIDDLVDSPYVVVGGFANASRWVGTFTLDDDDEDTVATIRVEDGEDLFNNVMDDDLAAGDFDVDTITPVVDSSALIAPNGGEFLPGGEIFTILWEDDDVTDTNFNATPITLWYFDGAAWELIVSGTENDGSFDWTVPELDIDTALVNLSAMDTAGNFASDVSNATFTIDSTDPEVVSVDITDDELSESDVGDIFNVTIEFSEDMDDGVDPTVEFDPALATTLVACAGDWKDDDIFAYWCTISDSTNGGVDVEVDDVDIEVGDAEDLAGNVQVDHTEDDAFSVDTIKPEVLDAWAMPDPANAGDMTITVDFTEDMDIGVDPVVEIDDLVDSPYVVVGGFTNASRWVGTFTLGDDDELAIATIRVEDGEDLFNNVMDADADAGEFAVDTQDPLTQSVEANKEEFRSGSLVRFMATVSDDGGVANATLFIWDNGVEEVVDTEVLPADGMWGGVVEEVFIVRSIVLDDDVYQWSIIATDNASNMKEFEAGVDAADNFVVNETADEFFNREEIEFLIDDLNSSIEDNSDAIGDLEDAVDDLELDIVDLQDQIDVLEADVGDNADAISDLEDAVDDLELDIADLQDQIDVLEADVADNADAISDLEVAVGDLEGDVSDLEDDLSALSDDVDALDVRLISAESDIDDLEGDVGDLETQVDALEEQVEAYFNFNITDTTSDVQTSSAYNVSLTTTRSAACTITDALNSSRTTTTAASFSHVLEVSDAPLGLNLYEVDCVDTAYGFSKHALVATTVTGFYNLDIPGTLQGFTQKQPNFLLSLKQLQQTSLANFNVGTVLNATAGPAQQQLESGDVQMVWGYNGSTWASYNVTDSSGDFTEFNWTNSPAYYELTLENSAAGKSIRH